MKFCIFQIIELLLSFCSVNGVRSVLCKILAQPSANKDPVKYQQLLTHTRIAEPFFSVIHWGSQLVQSHSTTPLLALDFIKEIFEVCPLSPESKSFVPKLSHVIFSFTILIVMCGITCRRFWIKV